MPSGSPRLSGLEIYRRLVLLHVELKDLAARQDSDDSIEGRTALAATAIMIRALASAFFRSLTRHSLAPEGRSARPAADEETPWNHDP